MMRQVCVLFMLLSQALSCVKYTFEEDFSELFTSTGFCSGLGPWKIGKYEDLGMKGFHEQSSHFIYPNGAVSGVSPLSCVSSFSFDMSFGGRIVANVFMENHVPTDLLQLLVFDEDGNDAGFSRLSGSDIKGGWYTMSLQVVAQTPFRSQLHIFGMSSPTSTVLIDSFRYIPPGTDPYDCEIYDNSTTVTEIIKETTENIIKSTTEYHTDASDYTTQATGDTTAEGSETTYEDATDNVTDDPIDYETEYTKDTTKYTSDSTTYYTTERSTDDITQDTTEGTTVNVIDENTDYTTENVKSTTDSAASTKDDSVDDTDDIKCTTETNVPSTEGLPVVTTDTTENPECITELPPESIPECPIEKVIKIEINTSIAIKFV